MLLHSKPALLLKSNSNTSYVFPLQLHDIALDAFEHKSKRHEAVIEATTPLFYNKSIVDVRRV